MEILHKVLVASAIVSGSLLAGTIPAHAKGCNGVVNQLVWGCAYWDNNNGPQYPFYKDPNTKQIKIPVDAKPQTRVVNGQQQVYHQGQWLALIGQAGGNLIGQAGGN